MDTEVEPVMGAKELVRMQQEDKKENADVGPGKGWKRGKGQSKLSHCKGRRDWMSAMQPGDEFCVYPKARYASWVNYVERAQVDMYCAWL